MVYYKWWLLEKKSDEIIYEGSSETSTVMVRPQGLIRHQKQPMSINYKNKTKEKRNPLIPERRRSFAKTKTKFTSSIFYFFSPRHISSISGLSVNVGGTLPSCGITFALLLVYKSNSQSAVRVMPNTANLLIEAKSPQI